MFSAKILPGTFPLTCLLINIPKGVFSDTGCEYPTLVGFSFQKYHVLNSHTYKRTQGFRSNLMCFSSLKSGFPWLPSLDLPRTTFPLMELVSRPTIRSQNQIFLNIFSPSTWRNCPWWLPSYTEPWAGVLRSISVSTIWERSAIRLGKQSYFAFRQLTTEQNRRIL